jgi:hypothetical protein
MIKPPKLEGYSVTATPQPRAALAAKTTEEAPAPFQIVLHGQNFVTRAQMLAIRIGDVFVERYSISPDQQTIVCYLDELPAEGSVISVGYGADDQVVLPEPFSRDKLIAVEPEPEV